MAFNVSALPEYVEQKRDIMLSNAAFGFDTFKYLTLQTGIKTSAAINLLNVGVELQDGAKCGFNAKGDDTFTQRIIKTGLIAVQKKFCKKDLLPKYTQYEVSIASTPNPMPFEEYIMEGVNRGIADRNEALVWQGDTSSDDENLKRYDGFIKIFKGDGSVIDQPIGTMDAKIDAVKKMLAAIPAKARKRGQVYIFCSPEFKEDYTQELVDKNWYHYAPDNADSQEVRIPGSSVILAAVRGLTEQDYLVAGTKENMFYGCDMESDKETYDVWYSQDYREHRLDVEFNGGVQVAFPDEIVLGTIA